MKQKTQKTIHENGIKSPTRNDQNANQNGKIIFNKFDLIQDPVEKAKLENQVIPFKGIIPSRIKFRSTWEP